MKDNKQIEEMTLSQAIAHAKEVAETREDLCKECRGEHLQLANWLIELQELRKNKPPENSVTLSREEWECLHNDYAKALYNARQNERKETAGEFLQLAYDRCLEKSFIKKVEELAKQYGVNIKE